MDLIDEQGRILGLVNVIDALAVFVVAAVVVAGVAFVLQPEPESPAPPDTASAKAVLDLGTQPAYVVEYISPGDTYSTGPNSNLTVTDVYVTPAQEGVRTFVSVELTGIQDEGTIAYHGEPLRIGRQLEMSTDLYQLNGTIRSVGSSLQQGTTTVLLETTVDASTAARIDPDDTYSLAGHDVATVERVDWYATGDPNRRRVFVGLSLRTVDLGDGPRFGSTIVREGTTIPFRTVDFVLSAPIRRIGATELRGEPTTRTVTLELTRVDPALANSLEPGMTEGTDGTTTARITDVRSAPATVILTSQDGNIYLREHPNRKDVTLDAEIRVRQTADGLTFKGRTIQQGSAITLDLGSTTIEAQVVAL